MLAKEAQELQELLAHPGWGHFKALLLIDRPDKASLKTLLNNKLMAEVRAGDAIKAAGFAGQIDIIPVILALPEKEIEKAKK